MSTLLLHGFTGAAASWDAVRTDEVAVTLPGHEDVPIDLDAGFAGGVEFVARAARGLPAPVHCIGYSMGGRLALGALVAHPELFASAALIGVRFGIDDAERPARREWEASIARALREDGLDAFLAKWRALPLFASQARLPAPTRAAQDAIRHRHDPARLADAFEAFALSTMPDYRSAVAAIEVPVTLIVGALDAKFRAEAEAVQRRAPSVRVEVVDGAGHNVVLEAPEAVKRRLTRALPGRGPNVLDTCS